MFRGRETRKVRRRPVHDRRGGGSWVTDNRYELTVDGGAVTVDGGTITVDGGTVTVELCDLEEKENELVAFRARVVDGGYCIDSLTVKAARETETTEFDPCRTETPTIRTPATNDEGVEQGISFVSFAVCRDGGNDDRAGDGNENDDGELDDYLELTVHEDPNRNCEAESGERVLGSHTLREWVDDQGSPGPMAGSFSGP
ncbi:hypothetical protein BRC83_01210 [Halobacteriales archaeon QS_1_68_17]|nr:MAG: hypothetical protein BRC83_01210 [Halobacteriales archaeon QS_1_68_17]